MANHIDLDKWDTVVAVNGRDIDVYVNGIKQTNVYGLTLQYVIDEMPWMIVERTPHTIQKLTKRNEGATK